MAQDTLSSKPKNRTDRLVLWGGILFSLAFTGLIWWALLFIYIGAALLVYSERSWAYLNEIVRIPVIDNMRSWYWPDCSGWVCGWRVSSTVGDHPIQRLPAHSKLVGG